MAQTHTARRATPVLNTPKTVVVNGGLKHCERNLVYIKSSKDNAEGMTPKTCHFYERGPGKRRAHGRRKKGAY